MKPLGPGVVFVPALLPWLQGRRDERPVVEIEPQTLWRLSRARGSTSYELNRERFAQITELPGGRLLHSVGVPFGGSKLAESAQVDLLRSMAEAVDPPWVSDHLSFNAFWNGRAWVSTGFFLPPRQVRGSVELAARNIQALSRALGRPIAFETGVNYLRPGAGEMDDGTYFAEVAATADCGILLDLYNLWANERNGRAPVEEVVAAMPLERVWEVHLAGGGELHGHQLDEHSCAVPDAVWDLASTWIPRMPNLGAIIFEILEEHVPHLGDRGIDAQWRSMKAVWALRRPIEIMVRRPGAQRDLSGIQSPGPEGEWERMLGATVIGHQPRSGVDDVLNTDPGVALFRQLVFDTRSGFVTQGLRNTMTLLLAGLGPGAVRQLLHDYFASHPPELFVSSEADAFAHFLRNTPLSVPFLDEVLAFEHALVRASLYEEASTVFFAHDPAVLLDSLGRGRVPSNVRRVDVSLRIQPEAG